MGGLGIPGLLFLPSNEGVPPFADLLSPRQLYHQFKAGTTTFTELTSVCGQYLVLFRAQEKPTYLVSDTTNASSPPASLSAETFARPLISPQLAQFWHGPTHRISACTELPASSAAPGSGIHFLTYSLTILVTSSRLCGLLKHAAVSPVFPCCRVHHSPILPFDTGSA